MSLPNYLARIKSSGIYRYVWDKSVVPNQVAETLRLVVGYSDKGPFNTPVYIDNVADFIDIFGNISKKMERKGIFFHRLAIQALAAGPILALNLKPFDAEKVSTIAYNNLNSLATNPKLSTIDVKNLYDTNRFWKLDADQLPSKIATDNYLFIAATDAKEQSCSIFIRKSIHADSYKLKFSEYFSNGSGNGEMPEYLESFKETAVSDTFVDVYVFKGEITDALKDGVLKRYFKKSSVPAAKSGAKVADENTYELNEYVTDAFGQQIDTLDALAEDQNSNFISKYTGTLVPYFKGANGDYISIDLLFNSDYHLHKMLMKLNESKLYEATLAATIRQYLIPTGCSTDLYLPGYDYTSIKKTDKDLVLQNSILTVLENKGIYTALTNRVDVEYRYIVDTFQSYVEPGCKGKLAALAKAKDNAFAILNFPAIQSFVDDGGFNDANGKFDIKLVKDNGKFTLASENNGASWCGYFTQVKFSDGTVKSIVPSAALVSNNFMEKYGPRQPYYIVAGPNYGRINYDGLIGPDYAYGRTDLDVLEPMGVNAIIYVPRKGTFINSNQTAKQTPVSGLSKIHIRELVIFLQDEIEAMLQDYQWELNTQTLRDVIKAKADTICERVQNNGGLYAFVNICDESNNTSEVIDNEMIVLDTAIEPARGAGKMVQTLTIHKTGGITSK